MNKTWTVSLATVVLSVSILGYGSQAFAEEAAVSSPSAIQQPAAQAYPLISDLNVEVKSLLNEKVAEGTRIGVVVKMKNNTTTMKRVPEYELRVVTTDGVIYTLQPSVSNPKAIQPLTNAELSYMTVLDRTDTVQLKELNWTEVDYYVYPKQETLAATTPITAQPWTGSDMVMTDPAMLRQWAETFVIPSAVSPIQYTPVELRKESTAQGTAYMLQLEAHNPSSLSETVTDFQIDGKSDLKVYPGKRVEQAPLVLNAGESKYIHYAIPVDPDTVLRSLNVLTTEQFTGAAGPVSYQVGRLNISLPAPATAAPAYPVYEPGTAMSFDPLSTLIHPDMKVSLQELHLTDNEDEGNKLATAKFQLTNESDQPLEIPIFQTRLLSGTGEQYNGQRQILATKSLVPHSSITLSYAYRLPVTETGEGLALQVLDATSAAPYSTTIASYGVAVQPQDTEAQFSVYPFKAKVESWDVSFQFSATALLYSYKAKFFLELERMPNVQVDASFPSLQFELSDQNGRVMAIATKPLTGANRLVNGENNFTFNGTSEQFTSPLHVKIYEVFTTDGGECRRLVADFIDN
ncbi:hypothetical protein [Paenibacillus silviterrae]|uniref:hypothetical protein n=1 Tax=Paenibacillus silviterrae TaxID=3242194 RepID=UPI002543A292|nr:hypothetical protein [Paenibacillus chinjuensis]